MKSLPLYLPALLLVVGQILADDKLNITIFVEDNIKIPISASLHYVKGYQEFYFRNKLHAVNDKVIRRWQHVPSGSNSFPIPFEQGFGKYRLVFKSPGYTTQILPLKITNEKGIISVSNIVYMYKARYIVLRYVTNTNNGLEFTGFDIKEGRLLLADRFPVPGFDRRIGIFQKLDKFIAIAIQPKLFDTGFLEVSNKYTYNTIVSAPEKSGYKANNIKLEKGSIFIYKAKEEGSTFTKFLVEYITTTKPDNLQLAKPMFHLPNDSEYSKYEF